MFASTIVPSLNNRTEFNQIVFNLPKQLRRQTFLFEAMLKAADRAFIRYRIQIDTDKSDRVQSDSLQPSETVAPTNRRIDSVSYNLSSVARSLSHYRCFKKVDPEHHIQSHRYVTCMSFGTRTFDGPGEQCPVNNAIYLLEKAPRLVTFFL